MAMRAARLVALDQMCAWADAGEHESQGPNRSPLIDRINLAAGVPLGSPYCAAAGKAAFAAAGIDDFGGPRAASVGYVEQWARDRRWLHTRPRRGDGFCWRIGSDSWPDHFGMVLRVRSWGGLLFTVDTVEANTSGSEAGSQDDGGGWYYRRRTFGRGRVSFVRDPRPARRDPFIRDTRPAAPKRIPRWAWRYDRWLSTRPAARGPRPGPKKLPGWFWPWRTWIRNSKGASK